MYSYICCIGILYSLICTQLSIYLYSHVYIYIYISIYLSIYNHTNHTIVLDHTITPTHTHHYLHCVGFFPRDGYLIEKAQIDKIRHIPTVICQGRYDVVCPTTSAWDLKKAFPEAQYNVALSGHAAGDPELCKLLIKATDEFKTK